MRVEWSSVRGRARNKLAAAVKASFGVAGFQLSKVPRLDSVLASMGQRRLKFLRDDNVTLVLDVGANCGQFGAKLREQGYEGPIISFEPLAGPFMDLEERIQGDGLWTARNLALEESNGGSTIHVSANTWSSSFLPMARRHVGAAPDSWTSSFRRTRSAGLRISDARESRRAIATACWAT